MGFQRSCVLFVSVKQPDKAVIWKQVAQKASFAVLDKDAQEPSALKGPTCVACVQCADVFKTILAA